MSIPSAPDPFLPPQVQGVFVALSATKQRSFPAPRSGENTGVFIVAGQSLAAGSSEGFYTPTNADKVDNLNHFDGSMNKAVDPLIGQALAVSPTQRASPFTRVADQLVSAGTFDRVVLAPVAIGGTTVAIWDAQWNSWIINAYRRLSALGFPVTAVLWQLGETDNGNGTSQSSYAASLTSVMNKVRAAGCDAPWILAKSTYIPNGTTSSGIRAAIDSLVNGVDVFAGPDCDTLGASYRYDLQHWNATGNAAAAALWTSAIQGTLP